MMNMTEIFYTDSNIFIFPVIYDNEKACKAEIFYQ